MTNLISETEEVVFKTTSTQFSALTLNNSSNNIILCLHGWLDNAASFLPLFNEFNQLSNLGKTRLGEFKIIAIDLPGHGKSSHKGADAHYHFIDWIYDVLALCETHHWSDIHIVGHSMGGMIASAFAAAFPEKVKSLTLIDSIGFIYADEKDATSQLRKGLLSRIKQETSGPKKTQLTLEKAIKARVLISDLEEPNARLIVTRNLRTTNDSCEWRSDRKLNTVSPYRLSLLQCKQLITDIKTPVQIIYGSKGLDFVKKGLDVFSPLIECNHVVELEGGHHVHMEKPEETAKLISNFISSI